MNFLVIGYGNTLRSDDGAGQIVAEKIAQWNLPGVRSLAVHQLTPELAEIIAQADAVIFIDAITTNLENPVSVQIKQLQAEDDNSSFGHTCFLLYYKSATNRKISLCSDLLSFQKSSEGDSIGMKR